jgi:hypothetical protein
LDLNIDCFLHGDKWRYMEINGKTWRYTEVYGRFSTYMEINGDKQRNIKFNVVRTIVPINAVETSQWRNTS